MIRIRLLITITIALLAVTLSPAAGQAAPTPPPPAEPSVTFTGGGFGHGIGMSQYGALGRAEAGQTAEQMIAFYYEGTQILGAASLAIDPVVVVDDVDVLVGTANCSTFVPSGPITIAIDGVDVGTTSSPVAISRNGPNGSRQYWWEVLAGPGARCNGSAASASITADSGATDFCPGGCISQGWPAAAWLTISYADGEPISVSAADRRSSEPDRSYAHGQILLLPDGRPAAGHAGVSELSTECGVPSSNDFCIVVGDMTMQQYLYGLAEVPISWPLEALRTQAIAGRSYALAQIESRTRPTWYEPFDIYASTKDQYYVGWNHETATCYADLCQWTEAVDATNDMFVATTDATIATTFYSSSNGGHTVANEDVWSGVPLPYLRAKPDPFDNTATNPNAVWEQTFTLADVGRWLQDYPYADLDVGTLERIVISDVPPSGRIDRALVTLYGTDRTLEVRKSSSDPTVLGKPYGYRFFRAIQLGCRGDDGCVEPLTSKIKISSFFDVPTGKWFTDPIRWISDAGISTGTSANLYSPFDPNSRSSVATFLWSFAGTPPGPLPVPFDDVTVGAEYELAVSWLLDAGITKGTSATEFSPDLTVTRGQAATFLWRFAGEPEPTVTQAFVDVNPDKYYAQPISWMVEWDITTGTSPQTFAPDDPVNRAEMATFLYRLAGRPEAFAPGISPPAAMRIP